VGKRSKGRPKRRRKRDPRPMDPLGLGQQPGSVNLSAMMQDMDLFAGCESADAARSLLRNQIQLEVDAMTTLVKDGDAFDVIELMRLRELAPVSAPEAAIHDSSALVIEIVTAVLLSRVSRKPGACPREQTRPHMVVNELHDRAQRLTGLAQTRQLVEARLSDDPLALLAAQYQGAVMGIRNMQYATIRDAHEARLFDNERAATLMQKYLGYTYTDVIAVRSAIGEISSERMTALRDGTAEITRRNRGVPPGQMPAAELDEFRSQMVSLMFLPGDRATISALDLATATDVSEETALAVLTSYAQSFDPSISAVDRVYNMLVGTNPFLTTPLVDDGEGNFVSTSNEVGNDSLRRIFEKALTSNSKDFNSYDKKLRLAMSEQIALEELASILDTPPECAAFTYYAPKQADEIAMLDSTCTDPDSVGKQVEGDGLFLVDNVAIVVETKGKSMADQSRRGDVRRFTRDLTATIGDACDQAKRLQELIETNRGIWGADRTWLDLSHVREIRSVVALLDDVGPLGTAIGQLQRAGVLSDSKPAWITSLHDLATIAAVSGRPAEFLHYLRVRTDSPATDHFWALDELDLYMLFLQGDLWVEADDENAINMVDDHCADLNAWMDRSSYQADESPPKPSFNAVPAMLSLVGATDAMRQPGWLRCGADLLSLSGEGQQHVLDVVAELIDRAAGDGDYHHCVFSFPSIWGRPAFFLAVRPQDMAPNEAGSRLSAYMRAKISEIEVDRAYGLVFDCHSRLEGLLQLVGG
jgi:hypothetical protein